MITLEILKTTLSIDDGQVASANSRVESLTRDYLETLPYSGPSDPYPDMTKAQNLIDRFGGEILTGDDAPEYEVGVVY